MTCATFILYCICDFDVCLVGEAGVPFFQCSGAEFDDMYVGTGANRVRQLFQVCKLQSYKVPVVQSKNDLYLNLLKLTCWQHDGFGIWIQYVKHYSEHIYTYGITLMSHLSIGEEI